eukprot:6160816-Alexandrium_andersonii.AAC.1
MLALLAGESAGSIFKVVRSSRLPSRRAHHLLEHPPGCSSPAGHGTRPYEATPWLAQPRI